MKQELTYVPYLDINNFFSTYDLGAASSLMAVGYKLIHIDKKTPSKALFLFESSEDLIETAQQYWKKELTVDAQTYFECIKRIKNQLYSS